MKKKRVFSLGGVRLLFIFLTMISISRAGSSPPAEQKTMIWTGAESGQKDALIKVVDTQKEWSALWKHAFDQPAPTVDFKTSVVACVFLGRHADWLYSIGFGDPYRRNDTWVIPYEYAELILELARPFKASGQYCMKVFEKKNGAKMILEKTNPKKFIR